MIPVTHFVIFSAILFLIGLYGVLTRRNLVAILMSIEIMLNAVNVNFIAFSRLSPFAPGVGQIFVIFIITIAAAEVAVALAIVVSLFRNRRTIFADEINLLKG